MCAPGAEPCGRNNGAAGLGCRPGESLLRGDEGTFGLGQRGGEQATGMETRNQLCEGLRMRGGDTGEMGGCHSLSSCVLGQQVGWGRSRAPHCTVPSPGPHRHLLIQHTCPPRLEQA